MFFWSFEVGLISQYNEFQQFCVSFQNIITLKNIIRKNAVDTQELLFVQPIKEFDGKKQTSKITARRGKKITHEYQLIVKGRITKLPTIAFLDFVKYIATKID